MPQNEKEIYTKIGKVFGIEDIIGEFKKNGVLRAGTGNILFKTKKGCLINLTNLLINII